MTEKEELVFRTIVKYIKENNTIPTMRFIQKNLGYKSINSITQYLKSLEKRGYLIRNTYHELTINHSIYNDNLKRIKIINAKNKEIEIALNKQKNYLGYKLNSNFFNDNYLIKGDVLIIEKDKKLNKNDLGLFIIDNKCRLMKYDYQDGFYILSDNETIYLSHVDIIGKVIKIIRTI